MSSTSQAAGDAAAVGARAREPVLAIDDVVVDFPTEHGVVRAVDGVSLTIPAGRRIGIVGESGSGKSTLAFAVLSLLESPGQISAGSIRSEGRDLVGASGEELRRVRGGRISMVFQDALGSLNPVMTIGAQIVEAIRLHADVSRSEARERAAALLGEVGVSAPRDRLSQYPHEFSGGMRQRVMIAMALSSNPGLLIADEPTTALDVTTQASVIDLLVRISDERSMAVLLITHDLGVVAGFAQDVLVMYAGAPVEYGSVDDIFSRPTHPYTQALMEAVPRLTDARAQKLRAIPGSLPQVGVDLPGCRYEPRCHLGNGRELCRTVRPAFDIHQPDLRAACHYAAESRARAGDRVDDAHEPAGTPVEGGELLRVESLSKTYVLSGGLTTSKRRLRAVDDVSFEIREGESLGLVGESGSGKSTVARVLLGLTPADAGRVLFRGEPLRVRGSQIRGEHRGRIQMVFQDPGDSLNPLMRVDQIVAEPLTLLGRSARSQAGRVGELLDLVGLREEHRRRRPGQLSGGQRQRVAIARALSTDPALLVCDEAVSSLDVSVRAQILNLLMELQRRLGLSYLFISHDLSVVRHVCDRVAVMYGGRFVEVADASEIFEAPQHPYTVALLSAVPIPDPVAERERERIHLEGEPPDLTKPLTGCVFRSRCWKPPELAKTVAPPLVAHTPGHLCACHTPENVGHESGAT